MFKWIITILFVLGTLTGCFNETVKNDQKKEKTSIVHKKETATQKQKSENGETSQIEQGQKNKGFNLYRPKVGIKKLFVGADQVESFSEEIVQENDQYVQSLVRIGQSTSVIIYKWTSDEISINSIIKTPSNPYTNYLNGIKESKKREMMLNSQAADAVWKVINKDETVETPYRTFHHVYVIRKITNEVEGADTIYTYYLAPQMGIVKETYQVTGDQGYTDDSVLKQVNE